MKQRKKKEKLSVAAPADIDAVQERVIRQMQRPIAAVAEAVARWVRNQIMWLYPCPIEDNFKVDIQIQGDLWEWSVQRPKFGIGARGRAYGADECIDMVHEAMQILKKVVDDEAAPVRACTPHRIHKSPRR